jgi:DNA-binding NarL/FixJ family response regulator
MVTRVFVVAVSAALRRDLAAALEAAGLQAIGDAAAVDSVPEAISAQADAVVLSIGPTLTESALEDLIARAHDVAIIVLGGGEGAARQLSRHRAGWAVVPARTAPGTVMAAIQTASAGLAVVPAHWPAAVARDGSVRHDFEADAAIDTVSEPLTPREREVLALLADGLSNRAIASRLGISEHTVKFHVSSLYGKLGAVNRADAVARGWQRGLVEL